MCGRVACNCDEEPILRSARILRNFNTRETSNENTSANDVGTCPNNEIVWRNNSSFTPYDTNISPRDYITVLHAPQASNPATGPIRIEIATVRWGIQADFSHPVINARAETVEKSNYFRKQAGSRCIVCVTGYMEWFSPVNTKVTKQPYYFYEKHNSKNLSPSHSPLLWLAGIWQESTHCVILTTDASDDVKWCHSRMPAVLASKLDAWTWINPSKSFADALQHLHAPNGFLGWHKIRPDFARYSGQIKKEGEPIKADNRKDNRATKKKMESNKVLEPYSPVTLEKYFGSKKFKFASLEATKKETENP